MAYGKVWYLTLLFFCGASGMLIRNHPETRPVTEDALVSVEVYYETLCPDSIAFIVEQLHTADEAVGEIMNVTLVPYGFATETLVDGQWIFKCQHGPKECRGNLIQSCAIHLLEPGAKSHRLKFTKKIQKDIKFVTCMENATDPSTAGPKCARKLRIKYDPILACVTGSEGNHLQHENAQLTEALNPKPDFIPWININGDHTDDIQNRALKDLIGLVCDTYQGRREMEQSKARAVTVLTEILQDQDH